MKRLAAGAIILSLILLSGCAKGSGSLQNANDGTKNSQAVQSEQGKATAGQNGASGTNDSSPKGTDKSKPNSVSTVKAPPLSPTQKAQVNENVTSVINSLNDVIKNLKEAQDIDLSGI